MKKCTNSSTQPHFIKFLFTFYLNFVIIILKITLNREKIMSHRDMIPGHCDCGCGGGPSCTCEHRTPPCCCEMTGSFAAVLWISAIIFVLVPCIWCFAPGILSCFRGDLGDEYTFKALSSSDIAVYKGGLFAANIDTSDTALVADLESARCYPKFFVWIIMLFGAILTLWYFFAVTSNPHDFMCCHPVTHHGKHHHRGRHYDDFMMEDRKMAHMDNQPMEQKKEVVLEKKADDLPKPPVEPIQA